MRAGGKRRPIAAESAGASGIIRVTRNAVASGSLKLVRHRDLPENPMPDAPPDFLDPSRPTANTDALYARGAQAFDAGRFGEAAQLASLAASIEPGLPAVQYLLGVSLLNLGRADEAVAALQSVEPGRAAYPLSLHLEAAQMTARARRDLARGVTARIEMPAEGSRRSVSLIICSVTPAKLQRTVARYRTLLGSALAEVIHIADATSLCEGYNRAGSRAVGDIMLFSHDDIVVVSPDFSAKLFATLDAHDFFGVAGSTRLSGPSWNDSGWAYNRGQIAYPHGDGSMTVSVYGPGGRVTENMQVADGLFLACRREVFDRVHFDEENFDGWNLYDLDFSYSVWKAGFRTCVRSDLLVAHESSGNYGPQWRRYADRFIGKWRDEIGPAVLTDPAELPQQRLQSEEEWRLFAQYLFDAREAAAQGEPPTGPLPGHR